MFQIVQNQLNAERIQFQESEKSFRNKLMQQTQENEALSKLVKFCSMKHRGFPDSGDSDLLLAEEIEFGQRRSSRGRSESKRDEKIVPVGDVRKDIDATFGSQIFFKRNKLKPEKNGQVIQLSSQSRSNEDDLLSGAKNGAKFEMEQRKPKFGTEKDSDFEMELNSFAGDSMEGQKMEQKLEKSNLANEKRKNFSQTSIKLQTNKLSTVSQMEPIILIS